MTTDVYGYFLAALCVLGTAGNLLTVMVLRRRHNSHKKKSTNWLLQVLAVIDSLYLIARLLVVLFQFCACRGHATWQSVATIVPYTVAGASLVHMVSIWTVVVITIDRYIAVSSKRRSTANCASRQTGGRLRPRSFSCLLSAGLRRLENRQHARSAQL